MISNVVGASRAGVGIGSPPFLLIPRNGNLLETHEMEMEWIYFTVQILFGYI